MAEAFFEQLNDPLIYVLLVAVIISLLLHEVSDAMIILVVVTVNAVVGVIQEGKAQKALEALKGLTIPKAIVKREGRKREVLSSELVVGDIVYLDAGRQIPADLRLLETVSMKVEESALTGESLPVEKDALFQANQTCPVGDRKNMAYMSTVVTYGRGTGIVTAVGMDTEIGKIAAMIDEAPQELTPLQKRLGDLGKLLSIVAVVLCAALFAIAVIQKRDIADMLITAISLAVAAVPEGLPMMNSLVQSMNTESMYKKNILVSHKAAFSDSAYMNVLFSDKTGTITQGNLSLVEFITGDGKIAENIPNQEFIEAITLNNLAKVSEGKPIGSNNMDRALLGYALEHGYDDSKNDPDKVADISGFDSEKKCATVTLKNGLVYWKGATENIIDKVTHYMLPSGEEKEFTAADKKAVEDQMLAQAKRTMKLLSVAKIADGKTVLMAVLCLRDNVRTDAVETVEILNNAGIQVVMVTGDAEETAVAIAKEAGILKDEQNDVVLTHCNQYGCRGCLSAELGFRSFQIFIRLS